MKVKEAIELIEDDGWYLARTRGSHRQYKHPIKSGLVTIAGKPSEELAIGTVNSILKQSQLKVRKIAESELESETINENNLEELE